MSWLKRKLPSKKWKRVLIYLGSVLLMLLALDMLLTRWWRGIEVSVQTTRITSPLNSRGTPDYMAALNAKASEGVTAGNNAAAGLLRVVGTQEYAARWREKILPQLGLPKEGVPAMFVPYEEWIKSQDQGIAVSMTQADEATEGMKKPWRGVEHPLWGRWMKEQQEAILAARAAVTKPRFYVPYAGIESTLLTDVQLPYLAQMRTLSNLLLADAMRSVGEGDAEAFVADVEATLALARRGGQGPVLIAFLVSVAIEQRAADAAAIGAAREGFLSVEKAQALSGYMKELGPLGSMSVSLDTTERWMFLDAVCALAASGEWPGGEQSLGERRLTGLFVPIHYNELLGEGNAYYDRMVAAVGGGNYQQRHAAVVAVHEDLMGRANEPMSSRLVHPSRAITNALMSMMMPSLERTLAAEETTRMKFDLARVALALRVYRLEHPVFPERLSEVEAAGVDRFVEKPLMYRKEGKGYVVYSVGPNGVDDGGAERGPGRSKDYDLVVRGE